MHATAQTSLEHYKTYNAQGLYRLITDHMARHPKPFCIADLSDELNLDKSTISARLNELKHLGRIHYAGKAPSRTTGVKSMMWTLSEVEQLALI